MVLYQCRKARHLENRSKKGKQRKGKTTDVWEKLDELTFYLGEGEMLDELVRYLTTSQVEDAVEFIARNNDYSFDDDETED